MQPPPSAIVPVLSIDDARSLETALFAGDEHKEWPAMRRAGAAVGAAILRDYREIGSWPQSARVLVLAGKGHNGGDALLAARHILECHPGARVDVVLTAGARTLRPLAERAYRELQHAAGGRLTGIAWRPDAPGAPAGGGYDLCIDGVFGFQFHPPVDARTATLFARVNALPIRFRAAVDLPSALGTGDAVRADFTYATGSVKAPVLAQENRAVAGRVRFLDLGFFEAGAAGRDRNAGAVAMGAKDLVLTAEVLAPLRGLRDPCSDKRTYGHLFIVGGSRRFPGAVLMSVLAALKAGAGLVTAFVPASLVEAFAARAPEAMWVGWPETPAGGLALEGLHLFRERVARATALVLGPGLTREPESLALAGELMKAAPDTMPVVIDADALQPAVVRAGCGPRVLTPHAGEFARISDGKSLREFSAEAGVVTVLKGPMTRISDGGATYHALCGGPVLARGGSGDLLAGMIGGVLAGNAQEWLAAACRGVVWHGMAADALARTHGQVAVCTTQLLDFLPVVLREDAS